MSKIESWHVHVYYNQETFEKAKAICESVCQKFDLPMGHMHQKNVGPHPRWSCQITVERNKFGRVIPWFTKNRDGLTIFIHANTGDDLKDHTDHTIWMGEMLPLNLDIFKS